MPLPAPSGPLELTKSTVIAPGGKDTLLNGVTFRVAPGQCLAVIGPSGSGKSTLARVITGIWPPRLGDVRLDSVNLTSWPKAELGAHIGYLPQDVELFDGTIEENIVRFGPNDQVELQRAVLSAGLGDLLEALPAGLQTALGADGTKLSGGQRQRIGLARALYGRPHLIVLDEPNANLDQTGDQALSAAIAEAKTRGAIVVVMTHRKEILGQADLLLALKDGSPLAFGECQHVLAELKKRFKSQPSVEHRP